METLRIANAVIALAHFFVRQHFTNFYIGFFYILENILKLWL